MTKNAPLVTQDELEEIQDLWSKDEVSVPSGFVLVQDKMIDQRRWVTVHNRVVKTPDGRYLAYNYDTPSTEMQEGSESTVEPEDLYEVEPHEVVTIVYKRKPVEEPKPVEETKDASANVLPASDEGNDPFAGW